MEILICKFNVDEYTEGRYNMIIFIDLPTTLVLEIKASDHVIISLDESY